MEIMIKENIEITAPKTPWIEINTPAIWPARQV
jgi:hypothetical protein